MIKQKVDKMGQNHYSVRVKDRNGRWYPARTFDRKIDAKRYERQLKTERDQARRAPTRLEKDLVLSEYWDSWGTQCRKAHPGWQKSQDQMYRDYIEPELGYRKFSEIRAQDVGQILSRMKRDGRSAQTRLHVYNLLHKMFSDAVQYYELIGKSPVSKLDRPKVPRKERAFLSPEDSERLLEVSKNHPLGPAIWLALYAGLRCSEIQALKVASLDFERSQVLIQAAFKRKVGIIEPFPKQEDWGAAPMALPLRGYLKSKVVEKDPDAFVVGSSQGGMLSHTTFFLGLAQLCERAGIKKVTPHELRHSCTELWVQEGATAEDIRRLLNQKSLSATQRYMHRTDGRLNQIADRIGSRISQSIEGSHLQLVKS